MQRPAGLKVLISRDEIAARVVELAQSIQGDRGDEPPILLGVLKGSFIFLADLIRAIDSSVHVEFLGVQSYGSRTTSSGAVQITQDLTRPVRGRDVVVVEDIIDTGLTADFLMRQLAARQARSVRLCALLHKPARSLIEVNIDYLGFTIEDVFVVGYGLDHDQDHRNLPDLCVLPQPGEA